MYYIFNSKKVDLRKIKGIKGLLIESVIGELTHELFMNLEIYISVSKLVLPVIVVRKVLFN